MSDDGKTNWGGLAKTILAGAAILIGVEMIAPGLISNIIPASLSTGSGSGMFTEEAMKGIGLIVQKVAGAVIAGIGLSYLFSDKSQNENAERHAEHFSEAKESFAVREDMRKMQTVMMARMKAAGHEPAMAAGPQMG